MRSNNLQTRITTGGWTLPVVIFTCTLCWVLLSFLLPPLPLEQGNSFSIWQTMRTLLLPTWAERIASYLVYATIGYILIELNNQFGIIRMRASIQTAIYFMLVVMCPEMHLLHAGTIAAFTSLFSIFFLFKSYQQSHAAGHLFNSFIFLAIGSIIFPQLTFLAVLWLIEAYRFQSLTLRSFCGALIGWTLPYWFLFGHAVFYNQMELFYYPFTELITFNGFFDLSTLQPWKWSILIYLFGLFTVSSIHCVVAGFEDKIRTRAFLQFFINLSLFVFLMIVAQPNNFGNLLPLLTISCSILIGHFFVLTSSKTSNVFFILSLILLTLIFAFNIWTLL